MTCALALPPLFIAALAASAPIAARNTADGIEWTASLAEARVAASRDHRPVLLYFTFDT